MDATLFLHYLICVIRTDLNLLEVLLLHPLLPFIKFLQVSQPLLLLPLFRNSRPIHCRLGSSVILRVLRCPPRVGDTSLRHALYDGLSRPARVGRLLFLLGERHSLMDDVQLTLGSKDSGLVVAKKWGKLVYVIWLRGYTLRSVHNDRGVDCTHWSVPATFLLLSRVERLGLTSSLSTFEIAGLIDSPVTGAVEGGGCCGEGGALCVPHEIGGGPWTFKLVVWDRGGLKLLGISFMGGYWFIMVDIVSLMVNWLGLRF